MITIKVKKGIPQKMDVDDNPTFGEWMARVDKILLRSVGLVSDDLIDQTWMAWYDSRLRPIRAANKALRRQQGSLEY